MTDYQKTARAKEAAQEYMRGVKLRRDASQTTDKSLADKFACSQWTINRAKNALPTNVLSEEDQALVRQLAADKIAASKQLPMLTKEYLGYKHQVSRDAIDLQLELLGFVKPAAKHKAGAA
ncbi:hypothetical protein HLV39_12315 [Marinobacter adhaerens]|uniref:Uncharacterized protein n=1 Tax=Marinobacter adhaerens TaxID=1033846 RepID=A0A851HZE0_9GAMM|nr:hypothetical protein [Marinobacter adhaerens]NWN92275.1 hypothetical protein [Marinobacter adhaerens]